MLFSVIIPVYNKCGTLLRAIKSVQNQTCQDYELIFVDDGSTDGSTQLLQELEKGGAICIVQENQGAAAARNTGIAHANGELITFLDADDEWLPGHLATLKRVYLEAGKLDGFYSTQDIILLVNGQSRSISEQIAHDFLPLGKWQIYHDLFALTNESIHGYEPFNTDSAMVPKRVLEQVGGFCANCTIGEDIDLWYRIALDYPVVLINEATVLYHREESTATSGIDYNVDWPFLETAEKRIAQNSLPNDLIPSVERFCDRVRIRNARHLLMRGKKKQAFEELSKIRHCRSQQKNLLITAMLFPLPASIIKKGFLSRHPNYYQ